MIVVVAALKGGVGKTTTSVYLSAVAVAGNRTVTLVDSDPQASAADWVEHAADEVLESIEVVEAPTERLLAKTLDRVDAEDIALVDTPPGHERLLAKALERADAVVIPTRVGGVETARVEAVLDMVPKRLPVGLVMASARSLHPRLPGHRQHVGGSRGPGVGGRPRARRHRHRARRLAVDRGLGLLPRGVAKAPAHGARPVIRAHRGVLWGHGRWTR